LRCILGPERRCRRRWRRARSETTIGRFQAADIPTSMFDTAPQLDCAGRILRLDRTRVMGIVNVTPDSFSDGGAHFDADAAVAHGLRLAEEGADLLDIGGESTRPGAADVSLEEELRRVVPVIERLARETALPISVDTS